MQDEFEIVWISPLWFNGSCHLSHTTTECLPNYQLQSLKSNPDIPLNSEFDILVAFVVLY